MSHLYDLADLEMLAHDCLTRTGVAQDAARAVARDVSLAEAYALPDGGFVSLLRDIRLIRYGRLLPSADVEISRPAPTILRVAAGHGFAAAALGDALPELCERTLREGMGMIHLTQASDPGPMAGTMMALAENGLAAIGVCAQGKTYAVGPNGMRVTPLDQGTGGMLDALLSLAPPSEDSPLDGPVAHTAWLAAIDPAVTSIHDLMDRLPLGDVTRPAGGIPVAPELLAQIVNA
ncbi:Ldh family oxidoreductase [Hasllibacter sp. MH4015]|uniref:Ldh family oxidoreductase n=1 Tax=Hasllibacter sp. MH4015 TaxID=2854029 RepID=UPI001CD511D1|nr:Ldh family oxidoreductase [Hasllibacter sp. MH4015]